MTERLTILLYPKNNNTACMTIKNGTNQERINHLWNYREFVGTLESYIRLMGTGNTGQESMDLFDKRHNKWVLVFCYGYADCRVIIWRKKVDHTRNPDFIWVGPCGEFKRSVADLIKLLP
ncbi:MAG TPA: hypothetical protein VKB19_06055 [Pedobacter sp.]|nr:hypothetical protein [Pedobacter sp.]